MHAVESTRVNKTLSIVCSIAQYLLTCELNADQYSELDAMVTWRNTIIEFGRKLLRTQIPIPHETDSKQTRLHMNIHVVNSCYVYTMLRGHGFSRTTVKRHNSNSVHYDAS